MIILALFALPCGALAGAGGTRTGSGVGGGSSAREDVHLSIDVAARATAVSGPVISISPSSHDFGRVLVGATSPTFDFTISNTGGADLHISGLTHSNPAAGFAADAGTLPATIAPGGSRTLSSSYSPAGSGPQTDNVTVESDATGGFFTVLLAGIANNAPVFNPALAPNYGAVGFVPFTRTFTADDSEGDPLTWSLTGLPVGATFDASSGTLDWPSPSPAGTYPMSITVSDGAASFSGSFTVTVTTDNRPPTAGPGGPYNGLTGIPLSLSGSASSDPDTGQTLSFAWTFGDGSSGTGATPDHTYAVPGDYLVSLTVTDNGSPNLSNTAATSATIMDFIPASIVQPLGAAAIVKTSGNGLQKFGIETYVRPVTDIDPSSIRMSTTYPNAGTVSEAAPSGKSMKIGDINGNAFGDLSVSFRASAIKPVLIHVPNGTVVTLVFSARTISDRLPVHGTIDLTKQGPAGVVSAASPNPLTRAGTGISYSLGENGPVSIRIFTVGGRLVRTLKEGEYTTAGTHEVRWDGRDDRGERVVSGIYFVKTIRLDETSVSKLVVMK